MKKVAIVQSNYIPWKGYFDMIASVDEFILYDDMQYTKRDWRNRNRIKTPQGVQWLTIPVSVKGRYHQKIREAETEGSDWLISHWKILVQNYGRSAYFKEISEWLEPLYLDCSSSSLSYINRKFIEGICKYLSISTVISNSWDYKLTEGRTERLANLCRQAGGTEYISGPAAKDYLDKQIFAGLGIELSWFDYSDYSEYPQLWKGFSHGVTILDLLFNCGKDSSLFMKYVK